MPPVFRLAPGGALLPARLIPRLKLPVFLALDPLVALPCAGVVPVLEARPFAAVGRARAACVPPAVAYFPLGAGWAASAACWAGAAFCSSVSPYSRAVSTTATAATLMPLVFMTVTP